MPHDWRARQPGRTNIPLNLSNLTVHEGAEGVRLTIKAVPGSSRDRIMGELGGALKIAITAAPERGRANEAIAKLLASRLSVAPGQVAILRGQTTAKKKSRFPEFRNRNCSIDSQKADKRSNVLICRRIRATEKGAAPSSVPRPFLLVRNAKIA